MNFDQLFKRAEEKGIEALQIHLVSLENVDFHVFNSELDKHQIADTKSLSIKGIYDGKMGKTSTEIIKDELIDAYLDAVIASAQAIENTDEVFIYEGDASYKDIDLFKESKLGELTHQDKLNLVHELEKKVKALDDKVKISQAFYGESTKKVILKNSKGLNLEKNIKNAILGADAVIRDESDSRSMFDFVQTNNPNDFDLDHIAHNVVSRGVKMLGAKSLASGKYNILLENRASASLLGAYASMFKAESVQKGLSKLKDKVNTSVAGSNITLVDDPFMKKSTQSGGFDDEGVATFYKKVIDQGTLTTYLYDLKTAKKDGVESTGNAFSGSISPTNFYFEKGNDSFERLLEELNDGLLITSLQGLHSGTNAVSGDFSLQASGFMVKNGQLDRPISLFTIAGNYLDLLKNVKNLGNDLKFSFSYTGSPTLRIDDVAVSGE